MRQHPCITGLVRMLISPEPEIGTILQQEPEIIFEGTGRKNFIPEVLLLKTESCIRKGYFYEK